MKLLIDAGNTRIKWALLCGEEWLHLNPVPNDQAHTLSARMSHLPELQEVWVSNVAGAKIAGKIEAACKARGWQARFIVAQQRQCGVRNGYTVPERLGSDRWAALVAAWHRVGGAALVVNCGTATTIDALAHDGTFLGGLILPGIALLQSSISGAAAQLHNGPGKYAEFPLDTADAITSGALQATCGAIQRQYQLLGDAGAPVLLGGGAAQSVPDMLALPVRQVQDMVLQGIKLIAQEASK